MLYTSNGIALLALGSNAVYKLWKWQYIDRNPDSKLWLPAHEIVMRNDTSIGNPEGACACIAISKDDSVMATSVGKVSFFCAKTLKVLPNFIAPLAPTAIAFHP